MICTTVKEEKIVKLRSDCVCCLIGLARLRMLYFCSHLRLLGSLKEALHLHFRTFQSLQVPSQQSPIPQPSEVLRPLPQDLSLLLVSQIIRPIRTQAKPLLLPACARLCVCEATLRHVMTQNTDPLSMLSGLWSQIYVRKGVSPWERRSGPVDS